MATTVPVKNGNIEGALREFTKKTSPERKQVRERKDGYVSRHKKRKAQQAEARKTSKKNNRKRDN